jgi:Zn-dependent metalloprotease/subtilisin-like proprotein convertase family protein
MVLRRAVGKRRTLFIGLTMFAAACASGDATPDGDGDNTPRVGPVRIVEKADAPVENDVESAAVQYVRSYDSNLRLTDKDDFTLISNRLGNDKRTHVRLQQTYQGIPVWGSDIVVHAAEGKFRGLNGVLAQHLPNLDLDPTLAASDAMAIGKQLYVAQKKDQQIASLKYAREKSDLVIFPRSGRDAALAWHVVFFTELQGGISPGLWNYFVDAHTGDVLQAFNALDTLEQASGPGGNPKVPRTWTDALDVEPSGGQYIMETARLVTVDMQNGTSGGVVVTGPLDPIGDAPINDAHGFAEQTVNVMQEWYGHNSIDDNGFVIRSRVHYSSNYENAFWDGEQMTYGDGASFFYPLSGDVDVVAHEIAHGYTTFHSNLTYSGQSGGMNESFSDINGAITEHYSEGDAADWDVGTDVFQSDGALRYMCDPTADGASIDHMSDYNDGLDVHYSSGVGNKAFCMAARRFSNSGGTDTEATAVATRRVGEAFYEANASYWTAGSTYQESCQGTMDAAAALGFSDEEREWLTLSWQDVGVYCDGAVEPIICDETITAESGTLTSPNYPNPYPDNFSHIWCIQPASGQPATLHFDAFNTESGYDFVTIKDANGAVLSTTSGTTAPADSTSTLLAIKFTSDGSVTATGWSAQWSTDGTSNTPPTVAITAPADGATVSGDVAVSADAADADGTVARVTFDLPDGTSVDDDTAPYELAWDSTTAADGPATISATAYDNVGAASAVASVNVTIENGTSCVGGTFSAEDVPAAIPDNTTAGIRSKLEVTGGGLVGSISLSMQISHTYIGDLRVALVSPQGTRYLVHNRSGGSADNIVITDLPLGIFTGQPAAGTWRLRVVDYAAYDTGTLDSWSLTINGDCDGGGGWGASDSPNLPTVDNGSVCTSVTVGSKGESSAAKLDISGVHDWRSVLRGTLEHNGTVVEAFPVGTFPSQAGPFELTDRPVEGLSGSAEGVWTLCVIDTDGYGDTGTLATWSVHE